MKVPVSLIIDDPAPVISVYHEHARSRTTQDGRPIIPTFENELLSDRVEWMSFEEIMRLVLENKEKYPKPTFD